MPLSYYVGALGGSGTTAYVGLHDIGGIQAGETVVISAAAGGVGSVAGQIARLRGCRVVGLVGSADKAAVVKDRLGFDAVINYREVPDLAAAVREACPEGSTSTTTTSAARRWTRCCVNMKSFGRIVGLRHDGRLQPAGRAAAGAPSVGGRRRASCGCRASCCPFFSDSIPKALDELHGWVRSGELQVLENVTPRPRSRRPRRSAA